MYIQWFAKGIGGQTDDVEGGLLTWACAKGIIEHKVGLLSNWWRKKEIISPQEVATVLTETNLDRHLHDYDTYGSDTPFISLAAGCVER